jgi:hypothetical protein
LDLLAHAEAHGSDRQLQGLQTFEQLVGEQRQLLGPRGGRHINGEHAARESSGLSPSRYAISDQAPPGIAVHGDPPALGGYDARSVQELSEHLGARAVLHQSSGAARAPGVNPQHLGAAMTPRGRPCYVLGAVHSPRICKAAFLVALVCAPLSCGGIRASTVPLGGKHEVEESVARARASATASGGTLPALAPDAEAEARAEKGAEEAQVVATVAVDPKPVASERAAPGAFQVRPYAVGQGWTRSFDLEFNVKVGPGGALEMRMVSHQEARFEVLGATAGSIDKLQIEYTAYTSKLTVMGSTQDSPEEVAGKRYIVTFPQGKPEVKNASGGTPPKKELDTVKDDAREPIESAKALQELSLLAAKGRADFSLPGAISLAGGEDEDTKVTNAKASLLKISTSPRGEKSAALDLAYTLTNAADDSSSIVARLSGNIVVLDAPARYQTCTLAGPLELRATDPGGMQGTGTTKLTVTYKY